MPGTGWSRTDDQIFFHLSCIDLDARRKCGFYPQPTAAEDAAEKIMAPQKKSTEGMKCKRCGEIHDLDIRGLCRQCSEAAAFEGELDLYPLIGG